MATSGTTRGQFTNTGNSSRPAFHLRLTYSLLANDIATNRSRWRVSLYVDNDSRWSASYALGEPNYQVNYNGAMWQSGIAPDGTFDFRDGAATHHIGTWDTNWNGNNANGTASFVLDAGIGDISPFGSANVPDITVTQDFERLPGAPGKPVASNVKATTATISWPAANGNGSTIKGYTLRRADNDNFNSGVVDYDLGNVTSYAISGLTWNRSYSLAVKADTAGGVGPWSAYGKLTTDTGAPAAPTGLTSTIASGTQINLSWTAPTDLNGGTLTAYEIQYGTDSTFATKTTTSSTTTSKSITGLASGTTYYFRVRGTGLADGAWSASHNNTTWQLPDVPSAPTISGISGTSANVSWTAPANGGTPITSYTVQSATNSAFTTGLVTYPGSTSGDTLPSLTKGTDYWVRVSATNAVGTTSYSAPTPFTTFDVPNAPTGVTASPAGPTSITVSWTAPASNGAAITSYTIQRATNSTFTANVATQTLTSGGTITGLAERTAYYVRVLATNSLGDSAYSASATTTTLGHPTVPQSVVATPSTTVEGRVVVTWVAPASTGGALTGYDVYRNGSMVGSVTGTTLTYTHNGLTPYSSYTFQVAARNAYSDSVNSRGPLSTAVSAIAPGDPTPPRTLTGTSLPDTAGAVQLSWLAPVSGGAGGVTKYRVRRSEGTLVAEIDATDLTYTVTGLNPGTSYTFKVHALNALSQSAGTESDASNSVSVTPVGEPPAVTGVTVENGVNTAGRQIVRWAASTATITGYNVFRRVGSTDTLIGTVNADTVSFSIDGLTNGTTYSYVVRARTTYTDTLNPGYPGSWGGPASAAVSLAASVNASQTVPTLSAASDLTNAIFNGTYTITGVTATSLQYAKTNANISSRSTAGTATNITNPIFNGTFPITSTPTPTTFTYAKTASNVANIAATGTAVNSTNQSMNGTYTVTAINAGANQVSYANTGANVSSRAVPVNTGTGISKTTNLSSSVFNGTNLVITNVTDNTFSYAKTNANIAESAAAGTATNKTNRDSFNGVYEILSVPSYNQITYSKTASNVTSRVWSAQNGTVYRNVSPSSLTIKFRSGWAG